MCSMSFLFFFFIEMSLMDGKAKFHIYIINQRISRVNVFSFLCVRACSCLPLPFRLCDEKNGHILTNESGIAIITTTKERNKTWQWHSFTLIDSTSWNTEILCRKIEYCCCAKNFKTKINVLHKANETKTTADSHTHAHMHTNNGCLLESGNPEARSRFHLI